MNHETSWVIETAHRLLDAGKLPARDIMALDQLNALSLTASRPQVQQSTQAMKELQQMKLVLEARLIDIIIKNPQIKI